MSQRMNERMNEGRYVCIYVFLGGERIGSEVPLRQSSLLS